MRVPIGTIPTTKSDICWYRHSPLSTHLSSLVLFDSLRNTLLYQAANGVSSSYDALLELFECIAGFLKRLHIYTEKIPMSSMMSDIIVRIMVEVLSVLALATKQIKEGRFSKRPITCRSSLFKNSAEKFAKKLIGEGEVEAVLQRLDRLTQEEARMTVAQTLEVVHGVFDNMKVVMAGTQTLLVAIKRLTVRIDGKASTEGIRQALGMFSLRETSK